MKTRKRNNLKIFTVNNDEEIPSYIRNQILSLDDKLASLITGYCRKMGRPGCNTLRSWHQFWTSRSGLVLLVEDPDNTDMLYDESQVKGFLLYDKDTQNQDGETSIYFRDLWVEPDVRKLHYGQAMVRKVFDMNPDASFEVSVMFDNTVANSFWHSVGFVTQVYTNYFLKSNN